MSWHERGYICFDGYQRFCLGPDSIRVFKHDHRRKYGMIRPYLLSNVDRSQSLMDLGCSAGVMGFQAYLDGYRNIVFVDHDDEYLDLVRAGLEHIGATVPRVCARKVNELDTCVDALIAFAIIHWLFSCTEEFGSLDRIIERLSKHGSKTLFIEWVGPDCSDVQGFGHLKHNADVQTDSYTRENFLDAMRKHYPHVKMIGRVRKGREIWMGTDNYCAPSAWARAMSKLSFWSWAIAARLRRLPQRLRGRSRSSTPPSHG